MYRICYGFYRNKVDAKKNLKIVQKKYPGAVIEEDSDGSYAIVFERESDYNKAVKLLRKIFHMGLWCGIETL